MKPESFPYHYENWRWIKIDGDEFSLREFFNMAAQAALIGLVVWASLVVFFCM